MENKFGRVGLLLGGDSPEREVSLRSGKAVFEALLRLGIDAVAIDVPSSKLIAKINEEKIDCCLIMLHGEDGENGHIQALLHMHDIPFSGSDMRSSAVAMDKVLSKRIWQALGLKTPKFTQLDDQLEIGELSFPIAVKPIDAGSSVGISKVYKKDDLEAAYQLAKPYGQVMAEEWIEGDEYTVSIVGEHVLPSIRIEASNDFYDYDAKYISGSNYHCPSGLGDKEEHYLQKLAKEAYLAVGCSGWGRVDFMREKTTGEFLLIELNTVPGMTNLSLVPQAAKAIGWDFDALVLKILESAL
ncbi:D-alanine--D-alanine ligase [Fangia hongkongensis]|uniref:D-alanine--D-alanine ligase n=1 Tax=Fangia hongkongensis TaxID=270495 RepID=UPI000363014D|nr:D-alanine--D-alanine ligase [Fangia hongkongensis]MBK2126129.1 D-alanine--D-alanine ligase [Fangia hongkongensis]